MPVDPESFPFSFHCKRSGNCCSRPGGMVRVTPAEVQTIAAHLQMTEAAFRSRYVEPGGDRLVAGLGQACVFLQAGQQTACAIYAVRPHKCQTWPYWDELRQDPQLLRQAMSFCPGITQSEEH